MMNLTAHADAQAKSRIFTVRLPDSDVVSLDLSSNEFSWLYAIGNDATPLSERLRALMYYALKLERDGRADGERWIPVEERLPSGSAPVLVCLSSGHVGEANPPFGEDSRWSWVGSGHEPSRPVTHWRALPEGPK